MKRPPKPALPRVDSAAAPASGRWPMGALFLLAFALLVVAYLPALKGDFLWDDAGHVTSPSLQSWSGLLRIWFEPGVTQQYYPLLHSAFWLEHQLWGDATIGYHLVNLLWHSISVCLLVAILRRLAVPGALLAGLLFALHPVCVESVAWISEQKNTLSTVFYLAAAFAWLRFAESERESEKKTGTRDERQPAAGFHSHFPFHFRSRAKRAYAIASLWFVAALLTKSVTATLPAALLVVAWWRRGRLSWRGDALPLVPWFVVGVGAGLFTTWFERVGIGAQGAAFDVGFIERVLLAGRAFWFYLGKLVWPAKLAFFYPRWDIDAGVVWQYAFPAGGLGLLGGLCWWTWRRGERGLLAAVLLFGGTLFPVLGFVNVYPFVFSYVADHFQYLASLFIFALASAGFVDASRRWQPKLPRYGAQAVAALVLVILGALTWRQSGDYVDSITLYRATLERSPDSWVAHHNLGSELTARGAPAEALPHAQRAVELKPDFPEALNNLADNLTSVGRAAEALPLLEKALKLQPGYAQAENTLGVALASLGRAAEGIGHFQRAIELQPDLAEAHYNLGLTEANRGDFAAAIPRFAEAVRLRPDYVAAELSWGMALAASNRLAEARPHFEHSLKLDPGSAVARQTYARVLLNFGQLEAAVALMYDALDLDPTLPGLHGDLAFALQQLGRTEEARFHAAAANRGP